MAELHITEREPEVREVCSPMHRCFPPQPTVCVICKATDRKDCPLDRAVGGTQQ